MLTRLVCWLVGHRLWDRAAFGEPFDASPNSLTGLPERGHYYRWERQRFCLRCGFEPVGLEGAPLSRGVLDSIRRGDFFRVVEDDGTTVLRIPRGVE